MQQFRIAVRACTDIVKYCAKVIKKNETTKQFNIFLLLLPVSACFGLNAGIRAHRAIAGSGRITSVREEQDADI